MQIDKHRLIFFKEVVNFFLFILKKESNRLKEEIASRDLQGHLIFVNLIAVLYIG